MNIIDITVEQVRDGLVVMGLGNGKVEVSDDVLLFFLTELSEGGFYPYTLVCVYPQTLEDFTNDVWQVEIVEVMDRKPTI